MRDRGGKESSKEKASSSSPISAPILAISMMESEKVTAKSTFQMATARVGNLTTTDLSECIPTRENQIMKQKETTR